jgi:hypothetical protein
MGGGRKFCWKGKITLGFDFYESLRVETNPIRIEERKFLEFSL